NGIVEVDPADPAALSVVAIGEGRLVQGLALRPFRDDEPWAVTTLDGNGTSDPGDDGFAQLVANPGASGEQSYSTGHGLASGLAWLDGDQFWTVVADLGLVRVDVSLLEAGFAFDAAIVQ